MTSAPDGISRSGAFEVVRRGYARDQVEASVRELERRLQAAENARRMAEQHAAAMAEELRARRAGTPAEGLPATQQSFGFRAEKVLRLAEREAADIRAAAEREAAAMREDAAREATELMGRAHATAGQARAEAEADRAESAAGRAELAARTRELDARAVALAHLRASVRADLARVHAAVGAELQELGGAAEPGTGPLAEAPGAGAGTTDAPTDPPTESWPVTSRPGSAVWTPTPGTADLFAQAPVHVPHQRTPDSTPPDGPDGQGTGQQHIGGSRAEDGTAPTTSQDAAAENRHSLRTP